MRIAQRYQKIRRYLTGSVHNRLRMEIFTRVSLCWNPYSGPVGALGVFHKEKRTVLMKALVSCSDFRGASSSKNRQKSLFWRPLSVGCSNSQRATLNLETEPSQVTLFPEKSEFFIRRDSFYPEIIELRNEAEEKHPISIFLSNFFQKKRSS